MSDLSRTQSVVITTHGCDVSQHARLCELAEHFQIAMRDDVPTDHPYLSIQNDRLILCDPAMPGASGVSIDLIDAMNKAKRGGRKRDQPLVRALGRDSKRIVDATAGLGGDTGLLLGFGYEVLAIERVGALAALLADALERADAQHEFDPPLRQRMSVIHDDAQRVLPTLKDHFDAVLIDPMFPPKRRESALAKKEIRIVRSVAGDDPDAGTLLDAARRSRAWRVVVKRPTHAPPLAPDPSLQYESKLVRYDVYIRP